jgi:hypothetical protein
MYPAVTLRWRTKSADAILLLFRLLLSGAPLRNATLRLFRTRPWRLTAT